MRSVILFLLIIPSLVFSQNNKLTFGLNIGGFQANKKTSVIYKGDVTAIDIEHYLYNTNSIYQNTFITYFKYPYTVVETPLNSSYRISLEIGAHLGIKDNTGETFLDINFANLDYQQYFTVAIDDPNNQNVEPTYEALPIYGEEKRLNINFGYSYNLYQEDENIIIRLPFFTQINSARLERNYFVINNQQYNIIHTSYSSAERNPGGIGYGIGTGLTSTLKFNDKFSFALGYYAIFSKIKMNENLQPWGLHHSFFTRIIWG